MADRQEFSSKTRTQAYERACGRCEWVEADIRCDAVLGPGNCEYDHVVAWAISRDSTLANCQALCRSHHALKTARDDIPTIAKVRRQHAAHIGAKVNTGPTLRSRGFDPVAREPRRLSDGKRCAGPSALLRRFGITEEV